MFSFVVDDVTDRLVISVPVEGITKSVDAVPEASELVDQTASHESVPQKDPEPEIPSENVEQPPLDEPETVVQKSEEATDPHSEESAVDPVKEQSEGNSYFLTLILRIEVSNYEQQTEHAPIEATTANPSEPGEVETAQPPSIQKEDNIPQESPEQPTIEPEIAPESTDDLGKDDYEVIQPEDAPIELAENYPPPEVPPDYRTSN